MTVTPIQTKNLILVLQTPEDVRAFIAGLEPQQKADMAADWLARAQAATEPDPWVHGFAMLHQISGTNVGNVAFKAPPSPDGVVELAYHVLPDHQGKGYATEAAQALTNFAFSTGRVRIVRAHTLAEPNASTRVLTKCGFRHLGEVIDPDDGPVWRWEKSNQAS